MTDLSPSTAMVAKEQDNNDKHHMVHDENDLPPTPPLVFCRENAIKALGKTRATAAMATSALRFSQIKDKKLIPVDREDVNKNVVARKVKPPAVDNKLRHPLHLITTKRCSRDQTASSSSLESLPPRIQHVIPPFCFERTRDASVPFSERKKEFYLKVNRDGDVFME